MNNSDKISWYPGHMKRAMEHLEKRIQDVQLFLELRDARVPFSSKNYHFDNLMQAHNKEKIIIFNKFDLCNQDITNKIIEKYKRVGIQCIATSARERLNLRELIMMTNTYKSAKFATVGMWLMICGMPNVGKSTIINQLRQTTPKLNKRKAIAKSTASPCTTKNVAGIKICDEPLAYLVDSPGVMIPNITEEEQGLKLGLVGCIKDKVVTKERMLDYLVREMNQQQMEKYYKIYGLNERPKTGGQYMLAVRERYNHYNYETTIDFILNGFRIGKLGNITLDSEINPKIKCIQINLFQMSFYPGFYPSYTQPLAASFATPVAYPQASIVRPVATTPIYTSPAPIYTAPAPVVTQSVVQPVVQSVVQPVVAAQPTIKGESRVEYREYQRPVVEYETETIEVKKPVTKYVTDYYPVEYQTDYIPRTVYETQTEYVPVQKTVPRVEYEAVERQVQRVPAAPVQYAPAPLSYSVVQPVQQVVTQPVASYATPLTYSTVRPAYYGGYPYYY
ncbi:unnamed protein product [Paramecium primaurelia]|uniref:EngC GTPase domain-containing protein n=1 Tax=Paramecium primaurelia TaxID=5886 RepID=A0A8S1KEE1_PARPR|nr:unnamed protein product [Paramecium primaurelia]